MPDISRSRQKSVEDIVRFYQLDRLSDPDSKTCSRWIVDKLADNSLFDEGLRMHSFPQEQVNCLLAMIEQNWIIIRQLDTLNDNLKKLVK